MRSSALIRSVSLAASARSTRSIQAWIAGRNDEGSGAPLIAGATSSSPRPAWMRARVDAMRPPLRAPDEDGRRTMAHASSTATRSPTCENASSACSVSPKPRRS
jgi:hypothetical protein